MTARTFTQIEITEAFAAANGFDPGVYRTYVDSLTAIEATVGRVALTTLTIGTPFAQGGFDSRLLALFYATLYNEGVFVGKHGPSTQMTNFGATVQAAIKAGVISTDLERDLRKALAQPTVAREVLNIVAEKIGIEIKTRKPADPNQPKANATNEFRAMLVKIGAAKNRGQLKASFATSTTYTKMLDMWNNGERDEAAFASVFAEYTPPVNDGVTFEEIMVECGLMLPRPDGTKGRIKTALTPSQSLTLRTKLAGYAIMEGDNATGLYRRDAIAMVREFKAQHGIADVQPSAPVADAAQAGDANATTATDTATDTAAKKRGRKPKTKEAAEAVAA